MAGAKQAEGGAALRKELADLLEVMRHLMEADGVEEGDVEASRRRRHEERGGFARRLWLRWTEG